MSAASTLTQSRICFVLLFGQRVMGMLAKRELCMKNTQRQIRPEKNKQDEADFFFGIRNPFACSSISRLSYLQLIPDVLSIFPKLQRSRMVMPKPQGRNMSRMQSGFRSYRNGGNKTMEESRGVCAGKSASSAACCLLENKQTSD